MDLLTDIPEAYDSLELRCTSERFNIDYEFVSNHLYLLIPPVPSYYLLVILP